MWGTIVLMFLMLQSSVSVVPNQERGIGPGLHQKWMIFDMGKQGVGNDSWESVPIEVRIGYVTGTTRKSGNLQYSRPGLTISGGLTFAIRELQKRKFFDFHSFQGGKSEWIRKRNLGIQFKVIVAETFGDEEESLRQVASLWRDSSVSVILGPQESCLHEAKLSTSLNIPMISYFCSDEETSDKSQFQTFSRTRPPDAAISRAIGSLVLKYGWTKSLVLIYLDSNEDPRFKRGAKSLSILFQAKGVRVSQTIAYRGPYHHGYGDNPFESIVASTKDTTRVYILISEYYEHLGLVLALKKENLLENGEYLVIGVAMDEYKEDEWNPRRYFRGLLHDEAEEETPTAFRSYLGIIASPPRNYTEFSRQVNRHMELPPFDWPNPLARVGGIKKIRIEAAYLYDAVFLYAKVLREILMDTLQDPLYFGNAPSSKLRRVMEDRIHNGTEIAEKLRNVSFKSATGLDSEMDENGDAVGNFTLLTLKLKNGEYGLYPVGYFVQHGELPALALREPIDWVGGSPPLSEPECGFYDENCQSDNLVLIAFVVFLSAILFIGAAAYLIFRHWRLSRDMDRLMWRIDKKEIEIANSGGKSLTRSGSQTSLTRFSTVYAPLVTYRGRIFAAKKLAMDLLVLDGPLKEQLKVLREIRHDNLNAFIGASELDDGLLLVSEYCSRGSIKEILENGDLKLDDMFISSLVGDLLRGLSYLHDSSAIRFHGNLKPTNCLVTSQWVLKLADFGITSAPPSYKRGMDNDHVGARRSHGKMSFSSYHHHHQSSTKSCTPLLLGEFTSHSPYLPPEIGRLWNEEGKRVDGFRKGDMYSLGVILWELLKRQPLTAYLQLKQESEIQAVIFGAESERFWPRALRSLLDDTQNKEGGIEATPSILLSPHDGRLSHSTSQANYSFTHLQASKQTLTEAGTSLKSYIPVLNSPNILSPTKSVPMILPIIECLQSCLQFDPELRPDLKSVQTKLRPLHKGMKSNIFDTMMALMEKYANNLECLVDERTKQLSEEKRKAESLLYELIPASVAVELKEGLQVPAQSFEMVSVYFSDVVSFTAIAAESTPIQVVEFLNDLYTCFDSVIENFNVYKVETIGDAYMVASGLPVPEEGSSHALEMARMALCLLQTVTNFRIRHRPQETLKLRIGLHSGPVCAGVVGQKRPRYCLFGDTVNTASRMESTGLPRRIHCSEAFAKLVETKFEMEQRGLVDVKGKGDMTTYWLKSERHLEDTQGIQF